MNLMNYVTGKGGTWFDSAEGCSASRFKLAGRGDEVTLEGPLTVNVSLVAEHVTTPKAGGKAAHHAQEVYTYDVPVPAGHTWTYRMSDVFLPPGMSVVLRAGGAKAAKPAGPPHDLPCDFASAPHPNTGSFFPSGCEGCPPGSTVFYPPTCGPSLSVPTAAGGCVRPRFFNGMFITREDMETQLRYFRLKMRLHNRAAGQGVAWGLAVSRRASRVRVETGYAVDCCGNDLTVTCPYEVEVATLLSDPAVCNYASGGPKRMHLLLEYVECPEEPRPVHGDGCSPQATSCETSRVRETVRLRLVPPRDWKPDGPIGRLLERLDELRTKRAAPSPAPAAPPAAVVPFTVHVENVTGGVAPLVLTPTPGGEVSGRLSQRNNQQVRLRIVATGGVTFGVTRVEQTMKENATVTPPAVVANPAAPAGEIAWTAPQPRLSAQGIPDVFSFSGWAANAADGTRYSATTTITLKFLRVGGEDSLQLDVAVRTTAVTATRPERRPWPCLSEACDPDGRPLFPTFPPFSHPDPDVPLLAADVEVLGAAAYYALAVLLHARGGSIFDLQSSPIGRYVFAVLQALVILLTRGIEGEGSRQLVDALRHLFSDWCQGLLYPGPECCGEPHGVVIGCATVKAGDVCEVDSWGGRRWMVRYPLVAHWLEQFGVTPPDVLASRLADFLCCVAGLPLPVDGDRRAVPGGGVVSAGRSFVAFGRREEVDARFAEMGVKFARPEVAEVTAGEFLRRAVTGLAGDPRPDAPHTLFRVAGLPDVYFAAPEGEP